MATLIKTRRRIASISSTRKITNAMEMVASVKLKRFKNEMAAGDNYIDAIKEVMAKLAPFRKKEDLLNKSQKMQKLYIVVNSNLGLCASYNNDIYKFTQDILKPGDTLIPIGLRGFNHYKTMSYKIDENYVNLNDKINFDDIAKFAADILKRYQDDKYQEIYIIYTSFKNSITFIPTIRKLLPTTDDVKSKEDLLPPVFEPDANTLYEQLIPIYITSTIYQAIVTSQVSEQASRRNAMENATDNADDILDKLKLEYNKDRQASITREITEVVSGANN